MSLTMGTIKTSSDQGVEKERIYSLEEFMRSDFDEKVELVEGKLVFMGWNNSIHATLVIWLGGILKVWAGQNKWGLVMGGDAGVETKSDPTTARGADLICISKETYAKVTKKGKIIDVGPELIIEIVSPSNTWNEIHTKIKEYFDIDTQEVWVVSPEHLTITSYSSPIEPKVFSLDGEKIVTTQQMPGLEVSLEDFEAEIAMLGEVEPD